LVVERGSTNKTPKRRAASSARGACASPAPRNAPRRAAARRGSLRQAFSFVKPSLRQNPAPPRQVLGGFKETYEINWPTFFKQLLEHMKIFNLDMFSFGNIGCQVPATHANRPTAARITAMWYRAPRATPD
jgi:hypothetical protein